MSLLAVRTAFEDLFDDSDIKDLSNKAYNYDILEDSNLDNRKYRKDQEINFFIYLVTKGIEKKGFSCEQETYTVEIKYYLENDKEGLAQNKIKDAFETIHARMAAVIGNTWNSTVDFYKPSDGVITLQTIDLGEQPSWLGSFSYEGFKQV